MTTTNPRILVLWADRDSTNLGLRALAEGTESVVARRWPNAELTYHTQDSQDTPLSKRNVLRDIFRSRGPIKRELSRYDAILDTGAGDSFTDIYGLRRLILMAYVQRVAAQRRVPTILMPQTIGPFDSRVGRLIARKSLRQATRVFARDPVSLTYARQLGRQSAAESTDLVFALAQPDHEGADERDVVVNVSGLLWSENPHVDYHSYRRSVTDLIDGLLQRGHRVGVLAHVLDSPMTDNDVPAVRQVGSHFGDAVEILVPDSLTGVRGILATANLVIGARMHACLNSLSVGTPAIPWAYSRKFAPLVDALGWNLHVDLRASPDPARETLALVESLDLSAARSEVELILNRTNVMMDELGAGLSDIDVRQAAL
ncbi:MULTISPECIES: polysaccharide pyruvyl transferase family protein [unclassified Rhodococcus (in: high G+C Gram-positive bacteria)]|uniref:polysaccharide pyruvyl transferase family protein n=1 Tax=unclassified Rhodococcus (in: high G+C Gram-positive bacteria) TaxID=192944 RepID=UPI00163B615A|nr:MULTISPECIES: polysaccharide pyruvyl transferase family protein [unclassified Rhodococcus (in: high G+C Gram-positive bacteria)]MBC2642691.1 polysaccharide pyruvyl transferase family protein [Rhodococcus sp. 3A]MBC2892567.1 polysaccharide pyruvyl transferase family protein [Rhodococcus sp. 4CII]